MGLDPKVFLAFFEELFVVIELLHFVIGLDDVGGLVAFDLHVLGFFDLG